jgi:23S rRNA (pseudouridine1915-N3)-methyltransferase
MKIALVVVGKTQSRDVAALIADYSKRIAHYTGFELVETEEKSLEKALGKYDRICLLEEIGKPLTSREFAGFVENQMAQGISSLAFVVGGPFGFVPEIKALADSNMSLSRMTFPHDLVRAIFLEQLYRAFTIMRNEKYHHD